LFLTVVLAVSIDTTTPIIIFGTDFLALKANITRFSSTRLTASAYGFISLTLAIIWVADATASTVNVHTNPILAFLAGSTKIIGEDAFAVLAGSAFLLLTDWLALSIVTYSAVSTVDWDTFFTHAGHARIFTLVNAVSFRADGTASTANTVTFSCVFITRRAWIGAFGLTLIILRIAFSAVAAIN